MAGFRTFIKQDETIGAIGGVSEKIDQNKDEIVTGIGSFRERIWRKNLQRSSMR